MPPLQTARDQASTLLKPHHPTCLGPTIATLSVGDLDIEVQDIQAIWSMAPPEANNPTEPQQHPGSCLVDANNNVTAFWRREPARIGSPYRYYWRWSHPPRLSELTVGDRQAALLEGEPEASLALIVRADPETCWYLWSLLPRNETLQLAEKLKG